MAAGQSAQEELLVSSAAELDGLMGRLESEGVKRCAVDTEADSLHSYREKLCLVQLSAGSVLAVIDPLKIDEPALVRFLEFLDGREVWLHGADFDMTLLLRTFGFLPRRILDTQLAARLIGMERFGLANLVEEHFDVKLSKSSQKADWGARPLREKMVRYAYDDVRYLLPLVDDLCGKLRDLDRWTWFEEWCETSRELVLGRKERSPDEVWRISGWGKLSRPALAYLREIWFWRDEESQIRDCPPFRIMANQVMMDLASKGAEGAAVRGAKGLNAQQSKRFRAAMERAAALPPEEWPPKRLKNGRPREDFDNGVFQSLRAKRDAKARELGVDPTIIATRGVLEALAKSREDAAGMLMSWQEQLLFGEKA